MVGHMEVPGLTGSEPASLSPPAYALLRSGDYGGPPFDGPVFTDDLSSMQAITDRFGRRRRGAAQRCRPVPTSRCGSPPTRCPPCSTGWSRRWRPGELTMPRVDDVGDADRRG